MLRKLVPALLTGGLLLGAWGHPLQAEATQITARNSFTVQGSVFGSAELPAAAADLVWKPELFGEYFVTPAFRLSGDLSMDNRLKLVFGGGDSAQDLEFKLYRAWAAASFRNTELKGGLQHIRMGVTQIFRPLMWFDRMNPGAFLEETEGVQALTFSHFFPNPELRLWLLPGSGKTKGAELLPTQEDSWEFGGRIGVLSPLGETGLSYHQREISAPLSSDGMLEHRIGFEQRVDGFMGAWLEAAVNVLEQDIQVPEKHAGATYPRRSLSCTLGGDYTFGVGNGLYLLLEHNLQAQGDQAVKVKDAELQGAVLMSYPLGLLDSLRLLASYSYTGRKGLGTLSWRRTYDLLSWDLSLSLDSAYPAPISHMPALSLTINYDL